jgi:hypothetical protein
MASPDFSRLFHVLTKQPWKSNQLLVGGDAVPTWVQGDKPGSVKMAVVSRVTGERMGPAGDKPGCLFLHVLAQLDGKGFQFDVERHLAYAKKNQHASTSVTQSVSFQLRPEDAGLSDACETGYDDLEKCYTTQLIHEWHKAGFKPSGNRQSADLDTYTNEVMDKLMFISESPYGPVSDDETGKRIFKASFKFAPSAPGRADPKPTKPIDAEIAAAFPGDHIAEFIAENPDQCIQFVKLHNEDGDMIAAADYYESAGTLFGPGAIVVVELMVPFGGETQYAGSKRTVIPKVVSLQSVKPGSQRAGGPASGPINWKEALRKMDEIDAAAAGVTEADTEEVEEDSGEKRKGKEKSKGGRKKQKDC